MIDWDRVRDLREEIGAEGFAEVVDLFLEEVEEEIGRLRDDSDQTRLEAQLHFLKGSALNLGFVDFSGLCHRGEAAAGAGQARTVDLAELLRCYEASKSAFLDGLKRLLAA